VIFARLHRRKCQRRAIAPTYLFWYVPDLNGESPKPIPLAFWRSVSGREPVREWLTGLPIALHGIIKKARKAPAEDLELAKQRLKQVQSWQEKTRT
jgi:hypothetical protein